MWHDFAAVVLSIFLSIGGVLADGTAHAKTVVDNFLSPPSSPTVAIAQPPPSPSQEFPTNYDAFHATSTETAQPCENRSHRRAGATREVAVAEQRPGKVLGASTEAQPTNNSLPLPSFVTHEEFSAALDALAKNLQLQIAQNVPVLSFSGPAASTPVNTATFAVSQKIDQLQNVTLTNATVNGLSGLTDADLPDSLTASNYLPLSGGTLTGDLTMSGTLTAGSLSVAGISSSGALIGPYVQATSTTATSTFSGGLFSNYGAFNSASFGATATSTFTSDGKLGIGTAAPATTLHVVNTVSDSGQYIDQFADRIPYLSRRANGTPSAPSVPLSGNILGGIAAGGYNGSGFTGERARVAFFTGENWSTSAQGTYISFSTNPLGLSASLTERMRIDPSGNVGINQTSPTYKLDVTGLGHFTGLVDAANFVATSTSATTTLAGGLAVETSGLVYD